MKLTKRSAALGVICAAMVLLAAPAAWALKGSTAIVALLAMGAPGGPLEGTVVAEARTNEQGEAVFRNLPQGKYTIVVTPVNDQPSLKEGRGVLTLFGPPKKVASFQWALGRRSYPTNSDGSRLVIPVAKGGEIRVQLSIFDRWG